MKTKSFRYSFIWVLILVFLNFIMGMPAEKIKMYLIKKILKEITKEFFKAAIEYFEEE